MPELKNGKPMVLVVAAAILDDDERVFICRRPQGKSMAGLWEFPGGKVEDGETLEQALVRELREELSIDVSEACLAPFTFASHEYEDFYLLMPLYILRKWKGAIRPQEHDDWKFVRRSRLSDYAMPAADIPLCAMLRDFI